MEFIAGTKIAIHQKKWGECLKVENVSKELAKCHADDRPLLCLSFYVHYTEKKNVSNYTTVVGVDNAITGAYCEVEFENPAGIKYTLAGNGEVFTMNRGYVNIRKLSSADVVVDQEGHLCKVSKKPYEIIAPTAVHTYFIKTFNDNGYFANGILVR